MISTACRARSPKAAPASAPRRGYAELGLRSQVAGIPQIELEQHVDRRDLRFMGDAAAYAAVSMKQAIADSGLSEAQISNPRTGLIAGSGGASSANIVEAADMLRSRGIRKVGADARAAHDGQHGRGLPRDRASHQGRELHDHLRLRDQRALHRRRRRADPVRQAGRDVLRRRRRRALVAHRAVRCDGRVVERAQRRRRRRHRAPTMRIATAS